MTSTQSDGDDFQTRIDQRKDGWWAVEYRQGPLESWDTAPRRFEDEAAALDYAATLSEEWDG